MVDLGNYLAIVLVLSSHEDDVLINDLSLVDLLLSFLELLDYFALLLNLILQDDVLLSQSVPLRLVFGRKLNFSLHLNHFLLKFADFAFVVLRFKLLFYFRLQYIPFILKPPPLPTSQVFGLNLQF